MQLIFLLLVWLRVCFAEFDTEIDFKFNYLPKEDFVEYFNNLNLSWKIKDYDYNVTSNICAHLRKNEDIPYIHHDVENISLPDNFDAREKWPNCPSIKEVYDQQRCGSCWTFGVATTASDRTCIHTGLQVRLSEQDVDCCKDAYDSSVCYGGYPDKAFQCWTTIGMVSQECRPYNVEKLLRESCVQTCENNEDYKSNKHYGDKVYQVANDDNVIRTELFKNGPIEVAFEVYEDFRKYTHGIYEHKFGRYLGGHSIRMIGYGEENGIKYWLAANSWGKAWGDNGLFKVKRYQSELKFENFLLTGFPRRS